MRLIFCHNFCKNLLLRIFAAVILLSWMGNAAPVLVAALAVEDACQMNCCQSAARHSAGSCAGGECHLTKKKAAAEDIICGADELVKKSVAANKHKIRFVQKNKHGVPVFDAGDSNSHYHDDSPFLQTNIARQNCETACSVGAAQSGQQQSRHDARAALIAFADKPRPPTSVELEFDTFRFFHNSRIISRQTPARAPPISFS